jgi:hypothetical protein
VDEQRVEALKAFDLNAIGSPVMGPAIEVGRKQHHQEARAMFVVCGADYRRSQTLRKTHTDRGD